VRWPAVRSVVQCPHGFAIAVVLFACFIGAAPASARTTTALEVRAAGAPQAVFGADGREHVEYDLVVTNVFSADATLQSLEVRGDGRRLLALTGDALTEVTRKLFTEDPTATVPAATTAFIQVSLVLPRAYGRTPPRRLSNRIRYAIPPDAPSRGIIGATVADSPVLRVDRRPPVVIAAPVRGTGWLNVNGCCEDPTSPHRMTVLASGGSYVTPEMFAIDWIRETDGTFYTAGGMANTDWPGFGVPLHAVADGTVVSTRDGLPDIPPLTKNPDLRTPEDYAGNNVIVRIAAHRYAVFDHLVTGSVRVRPRQRVRTGQVLGLLGNSGNTDGPHLHFGIQTRPDSLSASVPFEIDGFLVEGNVGPPPTPGTVTISGRPHRVRRALPLIRTATTLTPARP
jgi:peptidase M23-like protein